MTIFGAEVPFARLCGIEDLSFEKGTTRLRMVPSAEHRNNHGMVHGGAICTLLDIAMASAARLQASCPMITVDMQVAFLSAGRGILLAEGRVVRLGRSIIFAEADVKAEDGELVARSTGLFRPAQNR